MPIINLKLSGQEDPGLAKKVAEERRFTSHGSP